MAPACGVFATNTPKIIAHSYTLSCLLHYFSSFRGSAYSFEETPASRSSNHFGPFLSVSVSWFALSGWLTVAVFVWLWVMKHWHGFPREVEDFASLEIFKSHLDVILGSLL